MKQKILVFLTVFTLLAGAAYAVGNFKIQYPAGTDIFEIDSNGNVNVTGWMAENSVKLELTYLNIATHNASIYTAMDTYWNALGDMELADASIYIGDAGTDPVARAITGDITLSNTGVTTVINTQGLSIGNITDFATEVQSAELDADHDECSEIADCVPEAWESLINMTLTDTYIYVGDGSNNPVGVDMTGDVAIDNTGVTTVVNTQGIGYHNISDFPTCTGDDVLTFDGTDLSCSAGGLNSTEDMQDAAWDVLSGTQTGITVTYQDGTDDVDFVVDDDFLFNDGDIMEGNLAMDTGINFTLSITSVITGTADTSNSSLQIDATGNVIIVLV